MSVGGRPFDRRQATEAVLTWYYLWRIAMPTVSVKLPDTTKERLNRLAASQGTTAHALMVNAIESTLEAAELP